MIRFEVAGAEDGEPAASVLADILPSTSWQTESSFTLQRDRAASSTATVQTDDDRVVEVTLEDDSVFWTRADDLAHDLGTELKDRAGTTGNTPIYRLHTELPGSTAERGIGAFVIKRLKLLGVDLAGSISDHVAERVEGRQSPPPGLFRCSALSPNRAESLSDPDPKKPILVFLHGTASSTAGSFGELWASQEAGIHGLLEHYSGEVYAFQHRTLTQSPIENAVALVEALQPLRGSQEKPLRLHLVSHSRGGLIGELLCRGNIVAGEAFDAQDKALFDVPDYEAQLLALRKLEGLLRQRLVTIDRFVRVACPARGTTLADGRLDRYLSGLFNVMQMVTGIGSNPVVEGLAELILGVVKKRTEPQELPGLEAMMPSSPLIRLLNRPGVSIPVTLHVLGGDIKAGLWNLPKVLLSDLFYRGDHDLVVDTPSMLGGTARNHPVRYWIDTGTRVNHFRYFGNSGTSTLLMEALKGASSTAFRTLEIAPSRVTSDDYVKRDGKVRPIVLVLPGFFGSHLKIADQRQWLDVVQLSRGGVASLAADAAGVEADGLLHDVYGPLMVALADGHDVRPFPYDWRQSLVETATAFETTLNDVLDEAEKLGVPVRIVAHGMGGLVVRALLLRPSGQALWERLCSKVGTRCLMLGTPTRGSFAMAAMMLGRDPLSRQLALLDLFNRHDALLNAITAYEGALQLLPSPAKAALDLFDPAVWQQLHDQDVPDVRGLPGAATTGGNSTQVAWQMPAKAVLAQARDCRRRLENKSLTSRDVIYVAGVAPVTACDIRITPHAPPGRRVRLMGTAAGDGRVTWASGIPAELPGEQVYYMDAAHGDLASTPDHFPALLDLLDSGTTERLHHHPPENRGGSATEFEFRAARAERFPDRQDLMAAALGGSGRARKASYPPTQVRVVHGDLARSTHPVLVGHYADDSIISAEDYLDRQLNGRLRERHRLGVYPGRVGTALVVLNRNNLRASGVHPGGIVLGLGRFGELTPGALTQTVVNGVLEYALGVLHNERECRRRDGGTTPAVLETALTTLIIGGSSDLSVPDSLVSILRGIRLANAKLRVSQPNASDDADDKAAGKSRQQAPEPIVQIDRLDIFECWQDRAVFAARALRRLADSPEFVEHFAIERYLIEGENGRSRVCGDDETNYWQRMRIEQIRHGRLRFETFTARAKIDTVLQATQRRLVDRMLANAARSNRDDPTLGRTLFELLIPNEFKQYAPDRRRLLLMLDKETAGYPWELLRDGASANSIPLSVESGVVRQLIQNDSSQVVVAASRAALVVGDPTGSEREARAALRDPSAYTPGFPELPGAQNEARAVTKALNKSSRFDHVVSLIGASAHAQTVITELYARPYALLHIAAHGVFQQPIDAAGRPLHPTDPAAKDAPIVTGVVLGDGLFLTAVEIGQVRMIPPVVFINCCHLARTESEGTTLGTHYHRLAGSLATELIKMGVRAVLMAGWAVDDSAAKVFAEVFYTTMLSGGNFGEAVLRARQRVFKLSESTGNNTWGAYQCYGDPDYTLDPPMSASPQSSPSDFVAAAEMRFDVFSTACGLDYVDDKQRVLIKDSLGKLKRTMPTAWFDTSSMNASFGHAWGALGDYALAAEFYDKARLSEQADMPVRALEQLVNHKARGALQNYRAHKAQQNESGDPESSQILLKADEEFAAAQQVIDALIKIGATQERYSLKGGVHKRWAQLAIGDDGVAKQLRLMKKAYQDACRTVQDRGSPSEFYPLQNHVAAMLALQWLGHGSQQRLATMKRCLDELETLVLPDEDASNFWRMCRAPDLRLLRALQDGVLSDSEEAAILDAYNKAKLRGASAKDMQSIIENIVFFRVILQLRSDEDERVAALMSRLMRLERELSA